MVNKNLRIEISQKDGSILKANNTGDLKVEVDIKRQKVIITGGDIDGSIYRAPKSDMFILRAVIPFVVLYLIILLFVPNIYQAQKFLLSSTFILIGACIYLHFLKNNKFIFVILGTFILVAAFTCGIIPFEKIFNFLY